MTSLAPASRRRRSSSVSFHNQYSGGPSRTSFYQSTPYRTPVVKFRAKASFRSGITLAEAVNGVKLSGGDYLRWHEINADARGKIFLRVKVIKILSLDFKTFAFLLFVYVVDRIRCSHVRDSCGRL